MSRFFAASDSDSSSDSETQSNFSTDSSVHVDEREVKNKWIAGDGSDSDSDSDDRRLVVSAREKRLGDMRKSVNSMQDAIDDLDWISVEKEYDALQKIIAKAQAIFKRDGYPRFFIRALTELEQSLKNQTDVKKLNALPAKAFNALKQKIKKAQKTFANDLAKFKENPVTADESEDERENQESEEEEEIPETKFETVKKITSADLFERLDEIMQARGKKNTDKGAQIDSLSALIGEAFTPYQKIKLLMSLISARFDFVPVSSGVMSSEMWKCAIEEIKLLHDLLDANSHIEIGDYQEDDTQPEHIKDKNVTAGQPIKLRGIITSFVDRLDDEFFKSLQNMDPHTAEYVERLKDELELYALLVRTLQFAESTGLVQDGIDLLVMRRIGHLYYKPDVVIERLEAYAREKYPQLPKDTIPVHSLVVNMCESLYKSRIERVQTHAILCHIYFLALHDDYPHSRDLMLMSHLQDTIMQQDVQTQILFNHAMVQIGICAFRCGLFKEAHICLQEMASSGKAKELLAQGIVSQRNVEKTFEQEKQERQRQLPFHMHVNLELLECIYLTCALFLEIPNIAQFAHDSRRKVISKAFRRMFDYYERQIFTGPPENVRDHIMAAAKCMIAGNWEECAGFINAIKTWDLLPNSSQIKEKLQEKIQQESLRTYVFTYAPFHESLSLDSLSSMFSLDVDTVSSLISKMIISDELQATIDRTTQLVLLDRQAPGLDLTRLDFLAGQYSDKIASFVESNEKLYEAKCVQLGHGEPNIASQVTSRQPKASQGKKSSKKN